MFLAAPQLVHGAVHGTEPDFKAPAYADDGMDMIYVKDCGRAIALLQLADQLNYRTYNVAAGQSTTNRALLSAIKHVVPGTRIELPDGRNPAAPEHNLYLDITRIHQDTGFQPAYDTERAVADYVAWLRAGNER
jgi:UDP-glucose 4-epimerase